jgi:hypothetical protein
MRLPRLAMLALTWLASTALPAAEPSPVPAITIQDPGIPPDQLRWLLKPLTREDLVVEANAWRDLLKSKVGEIGAAEIALKRGQGAARETLSTPEQRRPPKGLAPCGPIWPPQAPRGRPSRGHSC